MRTTYYATSVTLAICLSVFLSIPDVFAADRVNVMPDRQVRPGGTIPMLGAACTPVVCTTGDGSVNGAESFSWSFTFNPAEVTVNGDVTGNLVTALALVTDDHNISVNATYALVIPATRASVTATLTVGATTSLPVTIDVVAVTDPISNTPLSEQAIDVNIAISESERYLYLQQAANGSWLYGGPIQNCATTGFAVWALSNAGHAPTQPNTDLYAEHVQRGVDFILSQSVVSPVVAQPNIGIVDANGNIVMASLCGGNFSDPVGYANPIATAGIIAAYSANTAATLSSAVGPFALGTAVADIVADSTDWSAWAQNELVANDARGGWRYHGNFPLGSSSSSDTSVDSWHYVAGEGFEQVFGGTIAAAVKSEIEERIGLTQCGVAANANFGMFNYAWVSAIDCLDHTNGGFAFRGEGTTGGGLSGLVLVSSGGYVPTKLNGGALSTLDVPDVATRIAAAASHLGTIFPFNNSSINQVGDPTTSCWNGSLMGNPYATWVTARSLRLAGIATLVNGAAFDWETGESPLASGIVSAPDANTEGFFAYLVRNQLPNGSWDKSNCYGHHIETALDLLVLIPTVFGPPQPDTVGWMTGGGSIVTGKGKNSSRVTHGMTLKCDVNDGPNNLQINWGKGNKFHLEAMTSAGCTDDGSIDPGNPVASFDTHTGSGNGRYNNVSGATITWVFTDAGEPGKDDFASVKIIDVAANTVLDVSGTLSNGNQQAHEENN